MKPGIYRHYKGNHYKVLYLARHSETMEEMVVYQQMYEDGGIWVRPATMFQEEITLDGKKEPRFRFIQEDPENV